MPLCSLFPHPFEETMKSWKSLMLRVPFKKLLSPQGDFMAQAPAGMMAIRMVKSPAPALQSEI